jgi:hypothetical protein
MWLWLVRGLRCLLGERPIAGSRDLGRTPCLEPAVQSLVKRRLQPFLDARFTASSEKPGFLHDPHPLLSSIPVKPPSLRSRRSDAFTERRSAKRPLPASYNSAVRSLATAAHSGISLRVSRTPTGRQWWLRARHLVRRLTAASPARNQDPRTRSRPWVPGALVPVPPAGKHHSVNVALLLASSALAAPASDWGRDWRRPKGKRDHFTGSNPTLLSRSTGAGLTKTGRAMFGGFTLVLEPDEEQAA